MLNVETAFTIPLGSFKLEIAESTVVTWILMVVLLLGSYLLTRNFTVRNPGKRQQCMEVIVTKLQGLVEDITGEEAARYAPYLTAVIIYIGFADIVGVFGFKPPTKDLNVTAALAVMSIVLVQYASIHAKGAKGWIKGFSQPVAIITPINILELFIRPLSLCMRLFGNVFGAFVIMELIKILIPVGIPAVFSLYFDFFDGLIQAYVFVFLTGLYLREAVE